jgi:UDP-N-acetylglucosamine acyltransferase
MKNHLTFTHMIHETAIIHPSVIVDSNVTIGANTRIGALSVIHSGVEIGENVIIGEHCNIGASGEHKAFYPNEGHGVKIGDHTIITGHVTIDSGTQQVTEIGQKCFIMKHAHVGHDAILEEVVTLSCGAKIGGHTVIMKHVNIGLNAVIHQKTVIGSYVMIGMGGVVPRKLCVYPFGKWVGNPAKHIGDNETQIIKDLSIVESIHEYNRFNELFELTRTW